MCRFHTIEQIIYFEGMAYLWFTYQLPVCLSLTSLLRYAVTRLSLAPAWRGEETKTVYKQLAIERVTLKRLDIHNHLQYVKLVIMPEHLFLIISSFTIY